MFNGRSREGWRTFPLPERMVAMKDAPSVLARSHKTNTVFAIAVRKSAKPHENAIDLAFEEICKRFDHRLMRCHRSENTKSGIIVFDKHASEETIQKPARDFRRTGHSSGIVRNLSEVPMFIDSRASRLVQLADLVAYSVYRHHEHGDGQFFDIISDRFDKHDGVVHGPCCFQ